MNHDYFELYPFENISKIWEVICQIRRKTNKWFLTYSALGPIQDLKLPPIQNQGKFQNQLWEETCFEIFFTNNTSTEYSEWNFSPSGNWAYYRFQDYRKPKLSHPKLEPITPPQIEIETNKLNLVVEIPLEENFEYYQASVILKFQNNLKSHWCFGHPPNKADFHQLHWLKKLSSSDLC